MHRQLWSRAQEPCPLPAVLGITTFVAIEAPTHISWDQVVDIGVYIMVYRLIYTSTQTYIQLY